MRKRLYRDRVNSTFTPCAPQHERCSVPQSRTPCYPRHKCVDERKAAGNGNDRRVVVECLWGKPCRVQNPATPCNGHRDGRACKSHRPDSRGGVDAWPNGARVEFATAGLSGAFLGGRYGERQGGHGRSSIAGGSSCSRLCQPRPSHDRSPPGPRCCSGLCIHVPPL